MLTPEFIPGTSADSGDSGGLRGSSAFGVQRTEITHMRFNEYGGWDLSADAWIEVQGEAGDRSRREILDPALEKILGAVQGMRVLDVGCGEGRYARVLASRGACLTGIDQVERFVNYAREHHPQGEYLLGRAEALPFADRAFDLVLSYLSLVDIPDYRAAVAEMCRVVKPTGRIVVVTIANYVCDHTGWVRDEDGQKLHRAVDDYMEHREIELNWRGVHIRNYHRPLSAMLDAFFAVGAVMDGFYEPLPARDSEAYIDEHRAPNFQIMAFRMAA